MVGLRFSPEGWNSVNECARKILCLRLLHISWSMFSFHKTIRALKNEIKWINNESIIWSWRSGLLRSSFSQSTNIAQKCNFWKGTLTVYPASLFFSSHSRHKTFHTEFFRYECRFQIYRIKLGIHIRVLYVMRLAAYDFSVSEYRA